MCFIAVSPHKLVGMEMAILESSRQFPLLSNLDTYVSGIKVAISNGVEKSN